MDATTCHYKIGGLSVAYVKIYPVYIHWVKAYYQDNVDRVPYTYRALRNRISLLGQMNFAMLIYLLVCIIIIIIIKDGVKLHICRDVYCGTLDRDVRQVHCNYGNRVDKNTGCPLPSRQGKHVIKAV